MTYFIYKVINSYIISITYFIAYVDKNERISIAITYAIFIEFTLPCLKHFSKLESSNILAFTTNIHEKNNKYTTFNTKSIKFI